MSRPFGVDHAVAIARRELGLDIAWDLVYIGRESEERETTLVKLGLPRLLKSGPRKGERTFRDSVLHSFIVTNSMVAEELARYEATTGKCGDCMGSGTQLSSWSKAEGAKYRACDRCAGSALAPNPSEVAP